MASALESHDTVDLIDGVEAHTWRAVAAGEHYSPHDVLGVHDGLGGKVVRALIPHEDPQAVAIRTGRHHTIGLTHVSDGIWSGPWPYDEPEDYRVQVTSVDGRVRTFDDQHRHLPSLGELDLQLLGEGNHHRAWTVLGARTRAYSGPLGLSKGTSFAVWAPNARRVSVVGDFNDWDRVAHPMRVLGSSGIWEVFVPGASEGQAYKFSITHRDGEERLKADPYARACETPPATASLIESSAYCWGDAAWMQTREAADYASGPMSVYEVHLGSWRPGLSYVALAEELSAYVLQHGFTHVELMPVAEHPFGGSWGYQVSGYYAPTRRFGSPDELRYLVDALHGHGIGVLLDWVPAHFPKDDWALARFDGQALYEHPDPRRGEQPDWGTLVFDYGRNEVRNFLCANALYWLEEFHIDGLRVDAVASMLYLDYSRPEGGWAPNQYGGREHLEAIDFLKEVTSLVHTLHPGALVVAEESTAWPGVTAPVEDGGLGFDFKWNMGWMHDSLRYVSREPIHRQHHHHDLTFAIDYAWSEKYVLPISHDEVVHGKGTLATRVPGDLPHEIATTRAYLAWMWAHPGKNLLFMGQEFAQPSEWSEAHGLDWECAKSPLHAGASQLVADLNEVYKSCPAMWERDTSPEGFAWLRSDDAGGNTVAFARRASNGSAMVCITNFSGTDIENYSLPMPSDGAWKVAIATNARRYAGDGLEAVADVVAEAGSATLTLPAMTTYWLLPAA